MTRFSNLCGVDDAPFARSHRGDVAIVGAITTRRRLDGVITGKVRRDGANATAQVAAMIGGSPFREHVQALVLNGIALAGFNVVDLAALHAETGLPVLVVARKAPDMAAIRRALMRRVPGGARKWRLIEAAGPMERCEGVYVQRAGISEAGAAQLVRDARVQGAIPEPIRLAHLIAGALGRGTSKGGA
ncbi:MAG: DUF99 family protein [Myxococcota bacterium]|nr:DUF99 family protein [Myxococcota bacterium]